MDFGGKESAFLKLICLIARWASRKCLTRHVSLQDWRLNARQRLHWTEWFCFIWCFSGRSWHMFCLFLETCPPGSDIHFPLVAHLKCKRNISLQFLWVVSLQNLRSVAIHGGLFWPEKVEVFDSFVFFVLVFSTMCFLKLWPDSTTINQLLSFVTPWYPYRQAIISSEKVTNITTHPKKSLSPKKLE